MVTLFTVEEEMDTASETSDEGDASEDEESDAEEPETPSPDKVIDLSELL